MDAATIALKSRYGYGKAATVVGRPVMKYRPVGALSPIGPANYLNTSLAAFDTVPQFTFINPQKFGNPIYYALMDSTGLLVGDYLVGGDTYFVATLDDVAAPLVVRCNHSVTFTRKGPGTPGPNAYGGDQASVPLLTSWPASMTQGTKGERGDAGLPRDPRTPWVQILIPAVAGVQIRYGDFVADDQTQPMRYLVSSVEETALGLRITASVVVV